MKYRHFYNHFLMIKTRVKSETSRFYSVLPNLICRRSDSMSVLISMSKPTPTCSVHVARFVQSRLRRYRTSRWSNCRSRICGCRSRSALWPCSRLNGKSVNGEKLCFAHRTKPLAIYLIIPLGTWKNVRFNNDNMFVSKF